MDSLGPAIYFSQEFQCNEVKQGAHCSSYSQTPKAKRGHPPCDSAGSLVPVVTETGQQPLQHLGQGVWHCCCTALSWLVSPWWSDRVASYPVAMQTLVRHAADPPVWLWPRTCIYRAEHRLPRLQWVWVFIKNNVFTLMRCWVYFLFRNLLWLDHQDSPQCMCKPSESLWHPFD